MLGPDLAQLTLRLGSTGGEELAVDLPELFGVRQLEVEAGLQARPPVQVRRFPTARRPRGRGGRQVIDDAAGGDPLV